MRGVEEIPMYGFKESKVIAPSWRVFTMRVRVIGDGRVRAIGDGRVRVIGRREGQGQCHNEGTKQQLSDIEQRVKGSWE